MTKKTIAGLEARIDEILRETNEQLVKAGRQAAVSDARVESAERSLDAALKRAEQLRDVIHSMELDLARALARLQLLDDQRARAEGEQMVQIARRDLPQTYVVQPPHYSGTDTGRGSDRPRAWWQP